MAKKNRSTSSETDVQAQYQASTPNPDLKSLDRLVGLREARILSRIPSSFLGEMYAGMGLSG